MLDGAAKPAREHAGREARCKDAHVCKEEGNEKDGGLHSVDESAERARTKAGTGAGLDALLVLKEGGEAVQPKGGGGAHEPFARGAQVAYANHQAGAMEQATVVGVHFETSPPHYTILVDGQERQTEATRLRSNAFQPHSGAVAVEPTAVDEAPACRGGETRVRVVGTTRRSSETRHSDQAPAQVPTRPCAAVDAIKRSHRKPDPKARSERPMAMLPQRMVERDCVTAEGELHRAGVHDRTQRERLIRPRADLPPPLGARVVVHL